ncbi:MAG: hypothetical protein IJT73_07005 [Selenomonadaceae bacterium]|nr:hypothetical protein [Selenomonadaceae bacterium]
MSRRVLLIEPNYKNKYPPLNLMKLSWYFRKICEDDVRFFKGDLKTFAAQLLLEEFIGIENFAKHYDALINFIKKGKHFYLENIPNLRGTDFEKNIWHLRRRFMNESYPKFEIICVNSLFTFYWKKTIDTINFAKKFLVKGGQIYVGGIAATLVPAEMQKEIGDAVKIHTGLLDKPDDLNKTDKVIIDELPPDYSILEETDYKYPARNSYFGYTTRGCIRRCSFCAVSTLEPLYKNYVPIQNILQQVENLFGKKQHLLLMDNNVLASEKFFQIVDDIKACGFGKGATYTPSDEYDLAIKNLRAGFNDRAYIKKIIRLYEELEKRLPEIDAGKFYSAREENFLLHFCTATAEKIFEFDTKARPLLEKFFKHNKRTHYVDFNQGLDARLIVKHEERMAKLAELNIRPLRIAFDHYEQKDIYEKAIRLAAKYGVRSMSNYILYNFHDTPAELYLRLKLNIDLCEELNVAIYSFPMKYHPIKDPQYFRNRDYLGEHWNKKFIRAIQAIINATKGKIGRGRSFFEKAFGKNLDEFDDLLWMPEAMIIYRKKHENLAEEWRKNFHALNETELAEAKKIVAQNKFSDADISQAESEKVQQILKFYQVTRED